MGLDSAFDGYGLGLSSGGVTGAGRAGFGRKISTESMDFPRDLYGGISGSMGLEEGPS